MQPIFSVQKDGTANNATSQYALEKRSTTLVFVQGMVSVMLLTFVNACQNTMELNVKKYFAMARQVISAPIKACAKDSITAHVIPVILAASVRIFHALVFQPTVR